MALNRPIEIWNLSENDETCLVLEFKEGWIHGAMKWLCYVLSSGGVAEE